MDLIMHLLSLGTSICWTCINQRKLVRFGTVLFNFLLVFIWLMDAKYFRPSARLILLLIVVSMCDIYSIEIFCVLFGLWYICIISSNTQVQLIDGKGVNGWIRLWTRNIFIGVVDCTYNRDIFEYNYSQLKQRIYSVRTLYVVYKEVVNDVKEYYLDSSRLIIIRFMEITSNITIV